MVAVIPAAGRGTRVQALTGGLPKELIPLGSKPVLRRVIDEAITAEPDEIVVISSPAKPQIEEAVTRWADELGTPIRVAHQREPRGTAFSLLEADVEDDVLLLMGDCVVAPETPLPRMANLLYRGLDGCIAAELVPDAEVHRYGILEVNELTGGIMRLLEKPRPEETPSRWASVARYGLSRSFVEFNETYCRSYRDDRELPVPIVIDAAIRDGMDFRAVALQPGQARIDCGNPDEIEAARAQPWD